MDPRHLNPEIAAALTRRMILVDAALEAGDLDRAESLDAELEADLDDLDHRLAALDEGGDVLDGDSHHGIEDLFIGVWSDLISGWSSLSLAEPARVAANLRSILEHEAMTGPYAPKPFLGAPSDRDLLLLAADLWNERQARILRAH